MTNENNLFHISHDQCAFVDYSGNDYFRLTDKTTEVSITNAEYTNYLTTQLKLHQKEETQLTPDKIFMLVLGCHDSDPAVRLMCQLPKSDVYYNTIDNKLSVINQKLKYLSARYDKQNLDIIQLYCIKEVYDEIYAKYKFDPNKRVDNQPESRYAKILEGLVGNLLNLWNSLSHSKH